MMNIEFEEICDFNLEQGLSHEMAQFEDFSLSRRAKSSNTCKTADSKKIFYNKSYFKIL